MAATEKVTPELALVDPELAARLRAQMPVTGAVFHPRRAGPDVQEQVLRNPGTECLPAIGTATVPRSADESREALSRTAHLVNLAMAAALAAFVAIPFLAFLPPRQGPTIIASAGMTTGAETLAWPRDPRATYYLVDVRHGDQRVLRSLPDLPTVDLPPTLRPGTYTWVVYAGIGPIDKEKLLGPIARGTFTVSAADPRKRS